MACVLAEYPEYPDTMTKKRGRQAGAYHYPGEKLHAQWAKLHRGDCERWPDERRVAALARGSRAFADVVRARGGASTVAQDLQQAWREDGSNRDLRHARNRVRHGIMPRLERNLNPSVRESLADTAEIARAEEDYWSEEVAKALPGVLGGHGLIRLNRLQSLPLALQRRVLRAAAEAVGLRLDFRHVQDVLDICEGRKKSAPMPRGWSAERSANDEVRFAVENTAIADYESVLAVPGATNIDSLGTRFEVNLVSAPLDGYPAEHLFDAALLNKELLVRNWRAGDRFWPAHTKGPKKIKELLQDRHVSGPERKLWPVIVAGKDVLWMRGFPCPAAWQCKPGATRAVLIREVGVESDLRTQDIYDADRES